MKHLLLLLGLVPCMISTATADVSTTSGTVVQCLDGEWQSARDLKDAGRTEKWFDPAHFPAGDARSAQVPGSGTETWPISSWWSDEPTNVLWYLKTFSVESAPEANVRYYLRFGAVKKRSEIWLNGTRFGRHEGGEDPFEFDVTSLLQPGKPNTVVVRLQMAMQGGINQHVALVAQPEVRILDAFARPDAKAGSIGLEVTIENNTASPAELDVAAALGEFKPARPLGTQAATVTAAPGRTVVKLVLPVEHPHIWDLNDPFLYTIKVTSDWKAGGSEAGRHDSYGFRTGFRDFRIVDDHFQLNGRRIFLKSLHGNFCDPIAAQGTPRDMTYLGRDLPQLKKAGFNMMRFIMSAAMPEQLDQADELGILLLCEHESSWLVHDPSKFGITVNQVVRRDRNHPSVVMWGLLNETPDTAVCDRAIAWLPSLRAIDDTRPVLLSSGRFDKEFKTASVSNTGSSTWDVYLGGEDPKNPKPTGQLRGEAGAYFNGAGDEHIYPFYPMSWEFMTDFVKLDRDDPHPFFLSECGIGSGFNPIEEKRELEKAHAMPTCPSWGWSAIGVDGITKAYAKYGLSETYPSMEEIFVDSALEAARQRELIFTIVRSNPKVIGYSLTSLEDFFGAGEGVMNNFREFKPGHLSVLQAGWAPLRWCLLVNPMNVYADAPLHIKVSLANEDALGGGDYPATIDISGAEGIVWKQVTTVHVQDNGPLAYSVMDEDIHLPELKDGTYTLEASLDGRPNAAANTFPFTVTTRSSLPRISGAVTVTGVPSNIRAFLTQQGAQLHDYAPNEEIDRETIVVGPDFKGKASDWRGLYARAARGAHLVFLSGAIFHDGSLRNKWLPLPMKGDQNKAGDAVYHKDVFGEINHPLLAGLQTKLMSPEYYGSLLSDTHHFEGMTLPADITAVAIYSSLTDTYHFFDGIMLGIYPIHNGHFTLNAFNIVGSLGSPATDRLLLNLVVQAQSDAASLAPLPADYNAEMDKLGFTDQPSAAPADTAGGWVKYEHNPIIGAENGTMFDIYLLHDNGLYRMWASWRPKKSIVLFESADGLHFPGQPKVVFGPAPTGWEDDVNRAAVVKREDGYHMWYSAENATHSAIGYATSPDGITWKRMSSQPVLSPTQPWEKVATLCADVIWDDDQKLYKMWYSAGPQSESDAIGYATSPDGMTWTKSDKNPIFTGDPNLSWEKERAVGCHVEKVGDWYYMFYIGFHDIGHAQLGVARSRDGVTNWQRLPQNPIIRLGTGNWDTDSCYKPYSIFDGSTWFLWYGGRNGAVEQVGVATHAGSDLGFPDQP